MSRLSLLALFAGIATTLVLGPSGGAQPAQAEGVAAWRFAPAVAPPPPAGYAPAPYPVPVGQVGDISFWAPNRGLLITGGTEEEWAGPVPAGLYTYDGREWRLLSTVCGGSWGRIAWAGPDEFWTIAEQRQGQQLVGANSELQHSISLCHFLNGQVVGSYAMPAQQPDSYQPMDGAACYGPDDCWFAGADGIGPNGEPGAFHLHWDGSAVTALYEPEDHAVGDMVNFAGTIYESVHIAGADAHLAEESQTHPPTPIHTIAPAGSVPTFSDVPLREGKNRLPIYGKNVLPQALESFSLATNGSPLGEGATELWAAANRVLERIPGSEKASLTVLRYAGGSWSQLTPTASVPVLLNEPELSGAWRAVGEPGASGRGESIAPEPGAAQAWLSLNEGPGAHVALLNRDGTVATVEELPTAGEPIGPHGRAGPIVCPAPRDCWMATDENEPALPGWLFHLSDGTEYPRNTDPAFAQIITYRPPDNGIPVIYPDAPPADDSLANQQPASQPSRPPLEVSAPAPATTHKAKRLVLHAHSRLVHGRTVLLSFTLTAPARVRLIARRRGVVVAKTPLETLHPGSHRLSLALNPARWPTGFKFQATPLGASGSSGGESESPSSGNNTIST